MGDPASRPSAPLNDNLSLVAHILIEAPCESRRGEQCRRAALASVLETRKAEHLALYEQMTAVQHLVALYGRFVRLHAHRHPLHLVTLGVAAFRLWRASKAAKVVKSKTFAIADEIVELRKSLPPKSANASALAANDQN